MQYLILWGTFSGLAISLYNVALTMLFLAEFKAFSLAYAFVLGGLVSILISALISYLQVKISFARLSVLIFGLLLIAWWIVYEGLSLQDQQLNRQFIYWGYVLLFPLSTANVVIFEGIFGRLFDVQQTKKLGSQSNLGVLVSGILGYFVIGLYCIAPSNPEKTQFFGRVIENIPEFLTQIVSYGAIAWAISFLVLIGISFRFTFLNQIRQDIREVRDKNSIPKLFKRRFYLITFLLVAIVISVLIDYFYLYILEARYIENTIFPDPQQDPSDKRIIQNLISFYAIFSGVIMTISFGFKSLLYRYVISRYNIQTSLRITPVAIIVFLLLSWITAYILFNETVYQAIFTFFSGEEGQIEDLKNYFTLLFILVSLSKLIKDSLSESLQMPVFRLCLLPEDINLRFDIHVKLEGFVKDMALSLGGCLILLLFYVTVSFPYQLIVTLSLCGLLLFVIMRLYAEYKRTLENRLNDQAINQLHSQKDPNRTHKSLSEKILSKIHSIHITELPVYLNLLNILDPVIYRLAVLRLIDSRGQQNQDAQDSLSTQKHQDLLYQLKSTLDLYPDHLLQKLFEIQSLASFTQENASTSLEKTYRFLFKSLFQNISRLESKEEQSRAIALKKDLEVALGNFRGDQSFQSIQDLIADHRLKIRYALEDLSSHVLQSIFQTQDITSLLDHRIIIPVEEEIRNLILQINERRQKYLERAEDLEEIDELKDWLGVLIDDFQEKIRRLSLDYDDDVQREAILQAMQLCILEAIPILDVISKSKYFAISSNAELITKGYRLLKGAEFRLERMEYIEQLTKSRQDPERVFGALLTIYAEPDTQNKILNRLLDDAHYLTKYQALVAANTSQNQRMFEKLIEKLDNPSYSNAAFSSIVNIGQIHEQILDSLEKAFYTTGQSERIQIRIIQIYGRVNTPKAVSNLISKLTYDNQNVSSLALKTLSQCGHLMEGEEVRVIHNEIEEVCKILVWVMAMWEVLQRNKIEELLQTALESEIQNNYNKIFSLLSLLYPAESVDLIQSRLYSGDPEKAEFALELLDVLLIDRGDNKGKKGQAKIETIKFFLLPLLNISTSQQEKLKALQDYFPSMNFLSLSRDEALISLVQKDYKWVNRWTKACALYQLSKSESFTDTKIFLANVVNPELILSEIAYKSLLERDRATFDENMELFIRHKKYTEVDQLQKRLQYLDAQESSAISRLKFDMARFMASVPEFSEIEGLILAELAKVTTLQEFSEGKILASNKSIDEMDYYIVFSGTVCLFSENIVIRKYGPLGFIHNLLYINQPIPHIILRAESDTVIYRIRQDQFNEIISLYESVPSSILKNSQLKYELVGSLHENGFISQVSALALQEVSKVSELQEYDSGKDLWYYDSKKMMNHYYVHSGGLEVLNNKKQLIFSNTAGQLLSEHRFRSDFKDNFLIRSYADSLVHKVKRDDLAKKDALIQKVSSLRLVKEFQNVNDLNLIELSQYTEEKKGPIPTDTVLAEKLPLEKLPAFIIREGRIEITYQKKDKTETQILGAREFIHDLKYLDQDINHVSLKTLSPTHLYVINREQMEYILAHYDQILLDIIQLHYPNSYFEVICFLRREVKEFKNLKAKALLDIAQKIQVKQYNKGDRIMNYSSAREMDGFIVYSGATYTRNTQNGRYQFNTGSLIHRFLFNGDSNLAIRVMAESDCTIYHIKKRHLDELNNNYKLLHTSHKIPS